MSIDAILADRKNTRAALAAEVEALRTKLSIAETKLHMQAPTAVAARNVREARFATRRKAVAEFFRLNPTARSVTPAQLAALGCTH